jgi:hypothetical protein
LLEGMGGRLEVDAASDGHAAIRCWLPVRAAAPPRPSVPSVPSGAVQLVGVIARGEGPRLALLLAPLGLVPEARPGAGGWALVVAEAASEPRASRARVDELRRESGGRVPIALLVRRIDREAHAAELQPPWDVLLELPLHGPRVREVLAPLVGLLDG